jgi:hypothetical protein
MPRWVKVFIIIGTVLVLGFVVTLIAGIDHGPGMHTPDTPDTPDTPGGHTPPLQHGP